MTVWSLLWIGEGFGGEMAMNKQLELASKESLELARAKCNFTLENLRILMLLRATSSNNFFLDKECLIRTELYSKLFSVSKEQTELDFRKAMEELKFLAIEPIGRPTITGWLSSYNFIEQDKIEFRWNPEIITIAEEDKAFGSYRLFHLRGLSTVLALKLYRYLNPAAHFREHLVYTTTLVEILGIEGFTGKDKELKELLSPAIQEINASTTLTITSVTKTGKGLKFNLRRKDYVKK